MAWPIPEVPPTKRATGGLEGENAALEARTAAREGILELSGKNKAIRMARRREMKRKN